MIYSIRKVSELAGVSARTLRYYDEIGLLKPVHTDDNDQRYYGPEEIELLQQILFFKERGLALKEIRRILYQPDFDSLAAMEEHLLKLETERKRMDRLISTVRRTIQSMKGEYEMSDKERFEAFKEAVVKENEEKYGKEAREKYGEGAVDGANQKMLGMTEAEFQRFKALEEEIKGLLEQAVQSSVPANSDLGRTIVERHREWLKMTWKTYTPEAHRGLGMMYTADERFKEYYDSKVEGCAELLSEMIGCHA